MATIPEGPSKQSGRRHGELANARIASIAPGRFMGWVRCCSRRDRRDTCTQLHRLARTHGLELIRVRPTIAGDLRCQYDGGMAFSHLHGYGLDSATTISVFHRDAS